MDFSGFLDTIDVFKNAIWQTLFMSVVSLVVSGVLGLTLGTALYATRPGNLFGNRVVFVLLGFVVNLVRPIPFVIFLAAITPLQIAAVGTTAVTFAISLAAAFAVARIVEQSLINVDPGVVEAARAVGASRIRILLGVVIPEGLGPLILGYTFIFIGIVDMTAQAGIVGGGGLGEYAITYGKQRYDYGIIYVAVLAIIIIVQVGQVVGNRLARNAMRR